ncbi:MAG: carboxymuconolactone decarboxylase family protein [Verrucomicrobiota bacterium]|jgi:AhpD family alkylhydroperoxidase|nr:carboxymuconolactone decarboxylase family protein [Verrucomicrobiota bacterium]MDD8050595.1 carboxymuconolactone decarboxylase family protein [Verrucomicrobiota bacterium]
MTERINLGKAAPELYEGLHELHVRVAAVCRSAGIEDGFSHLLLTRASQINRCAYCIRMHTRDALACGESTDRVNLLPAWRETGYFNAKERASLELLESITLVAEDQVPDSVYQRAREVLSEKEVVAVAWLAVMINAWNRIAVTSRYAVDD